MKFRRTSTLLLVIPLLIGFAVGRTGAHHALQDPAPAHGSTWSILDLLVPPAHATLRQVSGSFMFGPQTEWGPRTGSTTIFHPMSDAIESKGFINARFTYELSETNDSCNVRPALRYGATGVTWDADAAIDATNLGYQSANGIYGGTAYVDITAVATPKAFVQFGMQVQATTAGQQAICNVTLRVEPKERVR